MIEKAIKKINPNAKFRYDNDDINTLQWLEDTTPIPVADIQAQIPTVEAEIEQEKLDKEHANQSAIDKLKALGLTDAEIAAWNVETDWRDVFFNIDSFQQNTLGVTFGGENLSSYTSLVYFEHGGSVPSTYFKWFSFRNNLQAKS